MRKTRVLVVDDSPFIRNAITESLSSDPEIEVVGTAANGRIALMRFRELAPDLVTLDVDMPVMDGLATLRELRRMAPSLPVVMCSALTERGASATLDALAMGATCYITKPTKTSSMEESMSRLRDELLPKIRALGPGSTPAERRMLTKSARVQQSPPLGLLEQSKKASPVPDSQTGAQREKEASRENPVTPSTAPFPFPRTSGRIEIVVIGVSTGGPNALAELIPQLPADFPVPVAVVQHMPALFTKLVAERLNCQSALSVKEAKEGDFLLPGGAWIAPGDFHMTIQPASRHYRVALNQDSPDNFCRPSVNVLFRSATQAFGGNVLGVILTGMGSDGTEGCRMIRAAGGQVLAQDADSSVVWGMPGSVVEQRLADAVLPISKIAQNIIQRVSASRSLNPSPR
jgi:two-component system chemotaxis response regulator CheB